jgi:hypothetical protein
MRVKTLHRFGVLGVLAAAVLLSACGDVSRSSRSPVQLVVVSLGAASGADPEEVSGNLRSDVVTDGGIINDFAEVTLTLVLKDPGAPGITAAPTPLNAVTVNRYRVEFRRDDGPAGAFPNRAGIDVPHAFDSAFTVTVPPSGTADAAFELVRHSAKLEAPLATLASNGDLISTIATVTFYGEDQAGNAVTASGQVGVTFGNFADPED